MAAQYTEEDLRQAFTQLFSGPRYTTPTQKRMAATAGD